MIPNKTNNSGFQANRLAIQNIPQRSADPQALSVGELLHIGIRNDLLDGGFLEAWLVLVKVREAIVFLSVMLAALLSQVVVFLRRLSVCAGKS